MFKKRALKLLVVFQALILALSLLSVSPPSPARAAAVRIMPLGDSITGSPGCWRALLWNRLQTSGFTNIDFVGTLPLQGCSVPYDGDNEGHGGILATNMAGQNQLPPWLAATNPDIVIMHLGTNDVWNNLAPATILAAFSTLVDQMRANNPGVKILVAQIIPMNPSGCPDCGQRAINFNAAIPAWASGKSTAQSPIGVVDQWTGFSTGTDTGDGVHPNDSGNQKISDRWYPALSALLATGPTSTPTRTPTTCANCPTNTVTPSRTITATPTRTPTQGPGSLKVQLVTGGTDNNQQTAFHYRVQNTGTTAASNITVRVYFNVDGSQSASNYVLEKYYDQSGAATVSGPALLSGSTYYFTVGYGPTSLAAGAAWEYHTAIHLSNWSGNYDSSNDFWRATGALPAAFTDWPSLPAYVSGGRVWGSEPGGLTSTPTATVITSTATRTPTATGVTITPTVTVVTSTPTRTNTAITPSITPTRTNTATGVTNTPTRTFTVTNTSVTNTPSRTPTATNTAPPGNLKVQAMTGGTDNNQQTAFRFRVQNTGTTAQSNITVRIYFTVDGSNAATAYTLEKYYDQSGVATLSGPTQASGSIYYFTVSYGTASLTAGNAWEYQTALHLGSWGSTYNGANDWWHTAAALPAAYADWSSIPAYVSGSRIWGSEPGGATNTPTRTPTATATGPTPTPTATIPGTAVTGNATYFDALGAPYGGCGLGQAFLDTQNFVALNVQNTPGDYSTFFPRPIPAQNAAQIGLFNNGLNCGRWVRVTIGNFCNGVNDGAPNAGFCHGGSGWAADAYNGAVLDMIVADSCQDGNGWCRDDAYHLDLAKASLNLFARNGLAVGDMYPDHWNNRQVAWQFIEAPGYTGDIRIGFIQSASPAWSAIAVTHLRNGIHGVDYFANGAWVKANMNADMGQSYIIVPTTSGGSAYRVRVYDVNDQLINAGRIYNFSFPSACGTQCSSVFNEVVYTTE